MKRKKLKESQGPKFGEPVNDVELAHFESRLRIDKYNLDEEMVEQPRNFEEVADRLALARSLRDQAKDDLRTIEAEVGLDIRAEKDAAHEKVTEVLLANLVQVSPARREAFTRYVEAERVVNKMEGLRDSYRDRSFMLRELCELSLAAYFGQGDYRGGDVGKRFRDAEYEKKRAETHNEAVKRRTERAESRNK